MRTRRTMLWLWFSVLLNLAYTTRRDQSCPADMEWETMDRLCQDGKRYHCFEDRDGHVFGDGCYGVKLCRKGSHPVVEGGAIVCAFCKSGFQRVQPLYSNTFLYSYCESFSAPCDESSGYSECQKPSVENDRGCTCNISLGYTAFPNSSACSCFTQNDQCHCNFIGCPPGTVRSHPFSGKCVPTPKSSGPSTTMPGTDEPKQISIKQKVSYSTASPVPFAVILLIISFSMITVFGIGACVYNKICQKNVKQTGNRTHNGISQPPSQVITILEANNVYIGASSPDVPQADTEPDETPLLMEDNEVATLKSPTEVTCVDECEKTELKRPINVAPTDDCEETELKRPIDATCMDDYHKTERKT